MHTAPIRVKKNGAWKAIDTTLAEDNGVIRPKVSMAASGENNTGTVVDTGWDSTGKFGKALSFNGTTGMVTIGDAPSLRLTSGVILSAWVKAASVTGWRTVAMKVLSFGDGAPYGLYASDSNVPAGWLLTPKANRSVPRAPRHCQSTRGAI